MHAISAVIHWQRQSAVFTDNRYSRAHIWHLDGGAVIPASSSPHVVPIPLSDPSAIDPEEAFVASLSSCHMLWFLSLAANKGWVVDDYRDQAQGTLARNEQGQLAMTEVTLCPSVRFAGACSPDSEQLLALHEQAHAECFIAHSVKTLITISPNT